MRSAVEEKGSGLDPAVFLDPADVLEPGESCSEPMDHAIAAGGAHDAAAAVLEGVTVRMRVLAAELYTEVAALLAAAAEHPDPWVGPDPTLDPLWRDPRNRSVAAVRAERRDIAVRAAALDLAVRLGMSEKAVRARGAHADLLRERCPLVWAAFRSGDVSEQNAATTAQQAASLPPDSAEAWAAFDGSLVDAARRMPPGTFRTRARVARERAHPEPLDVRHDRAAQDRNVWVQAQHDGMAVLGALLPAADAHAAYRRLDAHARSLHAQADEERTLAQLRADALSDLVTTGEPAGSSLRGQRPSVAVTVPVLTLLGHGEIPAVLDGYGPIDTQTARRLAGEATSWVRILTHPVTGTVLDVDRTTYRVPKALRRWLGVREPACVGPGCTRPARDCQIDHRLDWQYGGKTSAENTAPLCAPHHVLKTQSRWRLYRDPTTGASWWVSPTALTVGTDPPPW